MRAHEVLVVVRRGSDALVLHRAPAGGAYWHLVAGGVEDGESAEAAAARELAEEVGLEAPVAPLPFTFEYVPTDEERELHSYDLSVHVECFAADAPAAWEPTLDQEHDDYRWCTPAAARELLFWPEPGKAVEAAFGA